MIHASFIYKCSFAEPKEGLLTPTAMAAREAICVDHQPSKYTIILLFIQMLHHANREDWIQTVGKRVDPMSRASFTGALF
ncbi:hypothetical protein B6A27_13700 [Anoxybacillus sp. UARK-01]|nr:hypothetical protein B6A27_13700 [Anoxybacillus sp. UARK-01]